MTPRERFDTLDEDAKARIFDAHRDINVDHYWWSFVYEGFTEDMAKVGISVDDMFFSGFWSQGDGACFEGRVKDWALFLPSVGYTSAALINHACEYFHFFVNHSSGRYYHEHSTAFDADLRLPETQEDEEFIARYSPHERDSLREAVWMVAINAFDEDTLCDEFVEVFKDHMRSLYKRLEAEYEYLTSDEAVLDSLDNNDRLEDAINETIEEEYENV
jgi:hypothetical protein